MREAMDLSGVWRLQPDPFGEGEKAGWHDPSHDVRLWREAAVPSTFDASLDGLAAYEGACWYRRALEVPDTWAGRRIVIRFEGVNYPARVWINGRGAGDGGDPFLPFEVEAGPDLRPGEPNTLVVRVDNERRRGEVPGVQRGWRPYGGILREVCLISTAPVHLEPLQIVAEPAADAGALTVRGAVANGGAETMAATVTIEVLRGREPVTTIGPATVVVRPGAREPFGIEGETPGAEPWSPRSPALYRAVARLAVAGAPVDQVDSAFGFRKVETREGRLLLNGEHLVLTGFNRHEDTPDAGPCPDFPAVRRDLEHMRSLGANFVRLCHYPHHSRELALCDEVGLLAMCEIPLYWWDGLAEGEAACAAKLEGARRQLRRMVERDANHPAVIFWSVSNETHEQRPEVVAGNAELVRLARSLDPTRLATHVSDHWREHPHFDDDHVACVNGYPTWSGRGWHADPAYPLAASRTWWEQGLEQLHAHYPDKPILVTEFGYPAVEGVLDCGVGEDLQAQAIEAEIAGLTAPYVCGATVWCYADHPWPEEPFIGRITTSPFGVVSRARRPKPAAEALRRLFAERQPRGQAAAQPASVDTSCDTPVAMERADLRDIAEVAFPPGFRIRPMRRGDGPLWTDIQRDAEPVFTIEDSLFEREFGADLPAVERRCFIVEDARRIGVGTISAWYSRDRRGQDWGRVHWVAVRPSFQGRGIGRAMLSYALLRLAAWHERAWLSTSTSRLAALHLYLDAGFRPDLEPPGAQRAWARVREHLAHPALREPGP